MESIDILPMAIFAILIGTIIIYIFLAIYWAIFHPGHAWVKEKITLDVKEFLRFHKIDYTDFLICFKTPDLFYLIFTKQFVIAGYMKQSKYSRGIRSQTIPTHSGLKFKIVPYDNSKKKVLFDIHIQKEDKTFYCWDSVNEEFIPRIRDTFIKNGFEEIEPSEMKQTRTVKIRPRRPR